MRGKRPKKRKTPKDPRYGSMFVTKFINNVMLHGKKDVAQNLVYSAIEDGAKEVGVPPMDFLNQLVNNVRPALEIKARRVGGANYQVPMPVSPTRQETLVMRWIIGIARSKTGASFDKILKEELVNAYNNTGEAVKKKEDTERMAEANKAFAHFRW